MRFTKQEIDRKAGRIRERYKAGLLTPRQIARYEALPDWKWVARIIHTPRPFKQARKFARNLGLKGASEWYEYCISGKKPDDIPSTPHRAYKTQFAGWGDWLGTGKARNATKPRPFKHARDFARDLGLKSQREWQRYCKSGNRPQDIPSSPHRAYKTQFAGYGDWLGTGNVRKEFRPFKQARAFARNLGFRGKSEWGEYCKSGKKPEDIPSDPYGAYKNQFAGWADWLNNEWKGFKQARAFARNLGFKSSLEWRAYCTSGKKPDDIPSAPDRIYKTHFAGWGDWLGTGNIATFNRAYLPFKQARVFVRALGLKSRTEWREYCKSGKKPDDIPNAPDQTYKTHFAGYGDWLGTGNIATFNRAYRPFKQARAFAHSLGLRDRDEWYAYCKSGKKPEDIPSNLDRTYKTQFIDWYDWLGKRGAV